MNAKLVAALLFLPLAAHAAPAPIPFLKAEAVVESEQVRIGDLIEHAGPAAPVPAFRAPDLGASGTVQVHRVIEVAREHGLLLFDTRGLGEVTVRRAARTLALSDLERAVAAAAERELGLTEPSVQFDRDVRALHIEPGATDAPRLVQLSFDPRTRRFSGRIEVAGSSVLRVRAALVSGTLQETAEVVVLTRSLARGETVRASELQVERRLRADVGGDVLSRPDAAVGLSARRAVRAGQPLRAADLMKPDLVARNEMVTIRFESGGIRLSARGKALDAGAEGDVVSVLNPQSKRILQATVEAPGVVAVNRAAASAVTGSIR